MSVKQIFNTSAELDFPNVLPTLDLDFANSKTLDPRITFTRASGGSYVGADGLIKYAGVNEARFDHDPATGESLGLLIEESRTNILRFSEEANNPGWNIISSSILVDPDVTTAPDGAQTADKVIETVTTGGHSIEFTGYAFQSGTTYTVSFYAKAAERSRLRVTWPTLFTNRLAFVDIHPATFSVISDGGTITTVIPAGNDWFRVISITTCTTSTPGARVGITLVDIGTNVIYKGDGISGIYLWGAQLEIGSFPTSYIPTQESTRTRAADFPRIIGKNFSEWYRQDEGTLFFDYLSSPGISSRRIASLNDSTNKNLISLISSNGSGSASNYTEIITKESLQSRLGTGTLYSAGKRKGALSYGTNDIAFFRDGRDRFNDSTAILPVVNRFEIGSENNVNYLNGIIRHLTYYPKRLPNSQLQSLTS